MRSLQPKDKSRAHYHNMENFSEGTWFVLNFPIWGPFTLAQMICWNSVLLRLKLQPLLLTWKKYLWNLVNVWNLLLLLLSIKWVVRLHWQRWVSCVQRNIKNYLLNGIFFQISDRWRSLPFGSWKKLSIAEIFWRFPCLIWNSERTRWTVFCKVQSGVRTSHLVTWVS